MSQTDRAKRKPLCNQVEDALKKYIYSEPLEVGDKLPTETELSNMFGVGRSTIREVVKSLEAKGMLEVRRGVGTYLCSKSLVTDDPLGLARLDDKYKLALELFDVRLMLEPDIAAKAAEYAKPEEIEQMRKLCDETEELYLADKDHMPKDIEFHTCIAKCSGNRVVETLIPIIQTAIMTFVNLTNRLLRDETISTHRAVMNAIASHDSTGAKCAMVMHLTYNRQELLRQRERASKTSDVAEGKTN